MKPRTLILGATGFIGQELTRRLSRSQKPLCLVRSLSQAKALFGDSVEFVTELSQISGPIDRVFNLAGAPIVDKPWTEEQKALILESRVGLTKRLVTWMGAQEVKPQTLVQGSAIGFYPFDAEEEMTEPHPAGTGFLAQLCAAWEAEALAAQALGVRVVLARTGLVLGPKGGILQKMVPPFMAYVGGPLGNGRQWMSWIHLFDHLGALELLSRDPSLSGPFNLTAPNPIRAKGFAQALGRSLKKPSFLFVPAFLVRLILGERAEMVLGSQKVLPHKLLESGFVFSYPEINGALSQIFATQTDL
ncbi:MAG: TIGR01777 family protein [Candidatus Lambdaproteobacteria bacterium RIFOXYD1_FULL_56_27]|uniref:TIGR01777 family protein n=1 Tax=Candidatus Lambdaproteobacteria bacterium RIFOXYD2_FULL_56_26 TaxID=1817773 RepID=A0A1F6GLT7_9PROT|nr:MAG: TIGR01777 family protein [Candidatus Lambdaproteobacteria bacterium RIFOXYD2_FULL_56_26]OGH01458.1 MAG: TIGR01777 family protein [Candidatus Lambdaproteobacteria bacterium RIFOXYC1_FULL_56_13]OGH07054.1 MAG: TIGR01777 family protein [Candidatus Lambdaproteobacteria bacterium RIFOXYD1_FULL_56_27]